MKLKSTTVNAVSIIEIPKITDEEGRGNLSVIEKDCVPFDIKRVYYLYDVPSDAYRGGHAHKALFQFLIPLSGSFDVILKDGNNTRKVSLNKPNKGLLIVPGIWRELENFSSGAVCLVLASDVYDEEDYVRNYNEFQLLKS
ncbi:MAG: dTDP-4-dehydrorhamnose 3,5-epimerase-like enzyme [Olleya marilimosa]|jgi:dTDP-4-dehydrorhamnose 3,5-epimerase-like enzyme|uniref:WxcM-like domain-containing protein n=1 Tax=Olleya marilimosa TaxID=272164 RepID=A0ABR8M0I2_9FLAO|nr:FdtA/QdtA family cupin domain-containing protein [Olleya marilimosa]MBD3864255.1 WxcM-like domain-containing protein [Olleya marilimosa]MBD3891843.1 WxcM-like domain-containing protein [Olleya marilimosa]|tara:strand:- start:30516 stop:30938 length:423 start_codon:yes stop_codon:yes gene_type:complete